jgi:hypothetical protein
MQLNVQGGAPPSLALELVPEAPNVWLVPFLPWHILNDTESREQRERSLPPFDLRRVLMEAARLDSALHAAAAGHIVP